VAAAARNRHSRRRCVRVCVHVSPACLAVTRKRGARLRVVPAPAC
jgi:hypothetical protein